MSAERVVIKMRSFPHENEPAEDDVILGVFESDQLRATQAILNPQTQDPHNHKMIVVEVDLGPDGQSAVAIPQLRHEPAFNGLNRTLLNPTDTSQQSSTESRRQPSGTLITISTQFQQIRRSLISDDHIQTYRQRLERLSPRELDVLILMMKGQSCKEIAASLEVGLATAAKHRNRVFKKLNVRSSVELIHVLGALFS